MALMAESYADKIKDVKVENPSHIDRFYCIEACFYLNKTIYNLSRTTNSIEKLYSDNAEAIYTAKNISKTRLFNIFRILDQVVDVVDKKEKLFAKEQDRHYNELNGKYRADYEDFKNLFEDDSVV